MTFDEWWQSPTGWNACDGVARISRRAFYAGAASRDAEIAGLHHIMDEEAKDSAPVIIERDQLREQVKMLRDALGDFDKAAINSKSIIEFAGQSFKLLTKMRKALAATEPKL